MLPSDRLRMALGLASALLAAAPAAAATGVPALVPMPVRCELDPGALPVKDGFLAGAAGAADPRLSRAIHRLAACWSSRTGLSLETPAAGRPAGPRLVIECAAAGPATPALGEDESYEMQVDGGRVLLRAPTTTGALRGLATLQQLLQRGPGGWRLPRARISDRPRFPWRGLLIDVARHWEPVPVIERNLDGMALVKLNVLHLHLTDDQGFRIEVKSHPELAAEGSDGRFYTQAEIRGLVAFAADRGIRVVPEFDLPGHCTSWLVSHPELASAPGPYLIERRWGVFDPVVDPTNEAVYRLLEDIFREMSALFPDPCVHLGGDENNGVQWDANARIRTFIRERGLGGDQGLQAYFDRRVEAILEGFGRRMVGWDEVLRPGLPPTTVIESWRGAESLARAARSGFQGILAHGFYLDLCLPASAYYATDPLPERSDLSPAERARILGGEAAMWGEWVQPETIDSRLWPRTAAIAERLWSPARALGAADLYRRLQAVSARLAEAGLNHESYRGPALDRLLGGRPAADERNILAAFIDAVQPVAGYARGKQQPGYDQRTPLIGVADAARPDSPAALEFEQETDALLSGPFPSLGERQDGLRRRLEKWRTAGLAVAGALSQSRPGLAPAAPVAAQLADSAALGLEALDLMASGRAPARGWRTAALARLAADAEPHDAVEIAALEPIRRLVLAAGGLGPPDHAFVPKDPAPPPAAGGSARRPAPGSKPGDQKLPLE